MNWIDNTQDRKMREKWNPLHDRFTVKTVKSRLAKVINIWIYIISYCSWIKNLKILLKTISFALTGFHFISFYFSLLGIVYRCSKEFFSIVTKRWRWESTFCSNLWTSMKEKVLSAILRPLLKTIDLKRTWIKINARPLILFEHNRNGIA